MKIYLAGKIAKHCWRSSLLLQEETKYGLLKHDPLRGFVGLDGAYFNEWPVEENVIVGGHDYVGPYFVEDDHGCGHGPNSHGASQGSDCINYKLRDEAHRQKIVANCLGAIRMADVVFAWIDTSDAFGSIFEIGYALAVGKRVLLALGEEYELEISAREHDKDARDRGEAVDGGFDMWFMFTAIPEKDRCFAKSAREGFDRLMSGRE